MTIKAWVASAPKQATTLLRLERRISGSPAGALTDMRTMLDLAARHKIAPQNEHDPTGRLESGKARYRIVLDVDF